MRLKRLFFGFVFATCFVAREDFIDEISRAIVTIGKAFFDEVGIFADDFDVEHGGKGDFLNPQGAYPISVSLAKVESSHRIDRVDLSQPKWHGESVTVANGFI